MPDTGARKLLVGFDSAWTARHSGALVGVLQEPTGAFRALGPPERANFEGAQKRIASWQGEHHPTATLVMLDQPTIVPNERGQRPVESLVSSPVGRRRGGVQPASTSRQEMFGTQAPLWPFLRAMGGPADPRAPLLGDRVLETYPVLILIALGWLRNDPRPTGRLPKYNPKVRRTFRTEDWSYVCGQLQAEFEQRHLVMLADWCRNARELPKPGKADQDQLDAALCLIAALHCAEGRPCLMVGDMTTGFIVTPDGEELRDELERRCRKTGRSEADWVRRIQTSWWD